MVAAAGSSGCDVHHKKTPCTCRELFTRNRAVEIAKQGRGNKQRGGPRVRAHRTIKGKPTKQHTACTSAATWSAPICRKSYELLVYVCAPNSAACPEEPTSDGSVTIVPP